MMPLLATLIKPAELNLSQDKLSKSDKELEKIVSKVAKKELNESEKTKSVALEQFRILIKNNEDVENVRTDDEFLLRFLRIKKYNVQLAHQVLLKYLNLKNVFPHVTTNLDVLSPNMSASFDAGYCVASPYRDKHGRRVLIYNIRLFDPTKYTSRDMAQIHFIALETLLCDPINQVLGVTHICNATDATFNHIKIWNLTEFGKLLKWSEQSLPIRHKEVHFVNVASGFRWAIEAGKKMIPKKVADRVSVHSNFEAFIKKVEPKVLPRELGGTEYTIKEMKELWKTELLQHRSELLALDRMKLLNDRCILGRRHEASHRFDCSEIQYQKVVGNFRKLEID